ncbi:MAG: class I SAM-dependent methyltransferase [Candidatus Omnitrophica bacterium]|nr:class I SAM-dependent methyltransferase [Candidatus Omnitrophota bacterium]
MQICPVCLAKDNFRFIKQYCKYNLYHCQGCDVIFSEPMENPGRVWYEARAFRPLKNPLFRVNWYHRKFLQDKGFYGPRLLDVGCGIGFFLSEAAKKGYVVYGVDFNRRFTKIAREFYGIENIFEKDIDEFFQDFKGEKFDIITIFEVLEHLSKPLAFIQQIKSVLKPRGYIVISIPNRNFIFYDNEINYPPHHLTAWNIDCMQRFLERNGFEVIVWETQKFDYQDLANALTLKFKLGLGRCLAKAGLELNNESSLEIASLLWGIKYKIFLGISFILTIFLVPFSLEGSTLYFFCQVERVK